MTLAIAEPSPPVTVDGSVMSDLRSSTDDIKHSNTRGSSIVGGNSPLWVVIVLGP